MITFLSWFVLVWNVFSLIVNMLGTFVEDTFSERVRHFLGLIFNAATVYVVGVLLGFWG